MHVLSARLTFLIPHAASLKDKRQVRRSLIGRARQRFNASIAEVGTQDLHQTLTIGIAVVSDDAAHALDEIIRFMEEHANAELIAVEKGDHASLCLPVRTARFPKTAAQMASARVTFTETQSAALVHRPGRVQAA